ncbi:hypothetical protein V499_03934 [Pseudogymnoascus sp. VKM F-103]|nr:hypothetical protein V499_03934 [Pseudogymnoascus sp. VKM F-103]
MLFLSLLVVPALLHLSAAQDRLACPREDFVSGKCKVQNACTYPDPDNCGAYFHCDWSADGQSTTRTYMTCPKSTTGYLEWNNNDKKCDVPEKSTCSATAGVDKAVNGVLHGASKILPQRDGVVKNKIRDEPFVCPSADFTSGKCKGQNGCMYPEPKNCRNYIQCDWRADGKTVVVTQKGCPNSADGYLEWNDKEKKCDSQENSTCPKKSAVNPMAGGFLKEVGGILPRGDGARTYTRDPAPFQCPMKDIMLTQCRGAKDCVYPNPGSCTTFIQCSAGSNLMSGTPVIKDCLPGHEWNNKEKKCDVPEKSTCPVNATTEKNTLEAKSKDKLTCTGAGCPGTVIGEVTNGLEDVLRNGAAPNRRAAKEEPLVFKCPAADIIRTKCAAHTDCVYARPGYCNEYIQCKVDAGGKTATPVVMHCPRDFEWNEGIKGCDDRSRSTCMQKTLGDVGKGIEEAMAQIWPGSQTKQEESNDVHTGAAFTCPTQDITKTKCKGPKDCRYPDPESCSHFYLCFVNGDGKTGTPYKYACGQGLSWNDNLKTCDWARSSTCKL